MVDILFLDGDIQVVSLHSNRPFYEGTMVQFFCEVDLIGSVGNIDVSWKLNNSKIRPTSLSRWRIETGDVENTKKYRLTVDPLRLKDSGTYLCIFMHTFSTCLFLIAIFTKCKWIPIS